METYYCRGEGEQVKRSSEPGQLIRATDDTSVEVAIVEDSIDIVVHSFTQLAVSNLSVDQAERLGQAILARVARLRAKK
jgi:hypothetical protein